MSGTRRALPLGLAALLVAAGCMPRPLPTEEVLAEDVRAPVRPVGWPGAADPPDRSGPDEDRDEDEDASGDLFFEP